MLRVGTVPYLVARPLDAGLEDEPGIQLCRAVPAELVERLRAGELDVALVSSIELFRRPGYAYLDGLAVAGEGHVSSVQVFLNRALEDVRTITLDPASRTAATLVRLVWPGSGERPLFREVPGRDPRYAGADAWLRIGDRALVEFAAPDAPPVFNPSAAWRTATGLPFVFAVWIVRPGVEIEPWSDAFVRARERGRGRIPLLVEEGARELGLPLELVRRYLERECLYEPGARLAPALEAFRERAAAAGLCPGEVAREVRLGPLGGMTEGSPRGSPAGDAPAPEPRRGS